MSTILKHVVLFCNLMVVLLVAATVQAQGTDGTLEAIDQVTIEDATGKRIGTALLHNDDFGDAEVSILFRYGRHAFTLGVQPSKFLVLTSTLLVFESPDCTGTPYLYDVAPHDVARFLTAVALGPPGQTLYLPILTSTVGARTIGSYIYDTYEPYSNAACVAESFVAAVIAARPVVNLTDVYQPPFRRRVPPPQRAQR